MGLRLFLGLVLLVGASNQLPAEQVQGNVTTIKSSGVAPNSSDSSEKSAAESKQDVQESTSVTESVSGNETGKISGWMKEAMGVTTYTRRLSNAVVCFQDFIQKIIDVRVKAYDLTLACGLQGAKYCKEQEKVVASSKVVTDQFYSCLDGKSKIDGAVAETTTK